MSFKKGDKVECSVWGPGCESDGQRLDAPMWQGRVVQKLNEFDYVVKDEDGLSWSMESKWMRLLSADDTPAKELGMRENKGKPKMSMLLEAAEAQRGIAAVLTFGADKYDRANWLKGVKVTECADSLLRHLTAFLSGEDLDPESGLPHVDHIGCNAIFLAQMFHTRKDMDDRPLDTLRRGE